MLCLNCYSKQVEPSRISLGLSSCLACARQNIRPSRKMGYPSYAHKTAGAIVICTEAEFKSYKKVSYRKNKGSHMGYASRVGTHIIQ